MNYLQRARELAAEIVADRRALHQIPEIAFNLEQTTAYVRQQLTKIGLQPQDCGRAGLTALVGDPGKGKTMLLRADMDALPMAEASGLPFAAGGDCAHTCGHDLHTSMLLGAARLLKENEADLPGAVKLMFQPAEETLEGAAAMVEAGVLENPRVDGALGLHVMPGLPTGLVGYGHGAVASSSDVYTLLIQGKGGHGSQPYLTVDPINVLAHIHIALQELLSREIKATEPVALTFGMVRAGEVCNIIPEQAVMKGTLRTYDREVQTFLNERIEQVAKLTAQAFRAEVEVMIEASTSCVVSDVDLVDTVAAGLRELLPADMVQLFTERPTFSDDFAAISAQVPTTFLLLGAGADCPYPLHHPQVCFDEEVLPVGAAVYAQAAQTWLSK